MFVAFCCKAGKYVNKPFHKMGHITVMEQDLVALREKVEAVKAGIRVVSS